MLLFSISSVDHFLDVTNFVHSRSQYYNTVDFKSSHRMLSVIVSRRNPRCIIELQMMPQFFSLFFCNETLHRTVSIHHFFTTLFDMKQTGFPLMTFSLGRGLDLLNLTFLTPPGRDQREAYCPVFSSLEDEDVGVIDYGTFVSVDSHDFLRIVIMLCASYVMVTLMDSQVKFAETNDEFVLTKEKRQCIIGGVAPTDETKFVITFNPIESLNSLIYWSKAKRVWLFKSNDDKCHGIIIVPIGLYARYFVHSTGRSLGKVSSLQIR